MNAKQERAILKEIARTYQNCQERVETYTRWRWTATGIGWVLIFVAFLLSYFESISCRLCMVSALLGGVAVGVAIFLGTSAKQLPFLVSYTTIRDEDIQKRLEGLKDA
jgi:hypothetical protein